MKKEQIKALCIMELFSCCLKEHKAKMSPPQFRNFCETFISAASNSWSLLCSVIVFLWKTLKGLINVYKWWLFKRHRVLAIDLDFMVISLSWNSYCCLFMDERTVVIQYDCYSGACEKIFIWFRSIVLMSGWISTSNYTRTLADSHSLDVLFPFCFLDDLSEFSRATLR